MWSGWQSGASAPLRTTCDAPGMHSEAPQQTDELLGIGHDEVRRLTQLRWALVRRDSHPDRHVEAVERPEAVEVGRVVAGVERAAQVPFGEQLPHRRPLVHIQPGKHLEHLSPEAGDEALELRSL